jgi:hypothetical protein
MDGGSSLNILYANTLELLELDQSRLQDDAAPFHGIMLGKRTRPLGRIDLPVCFDTPSNYAMFMAIPNYTYLKLKMSGPNGVITVESMYEHAYDCDVECIEYAEALLEAETLIVNLDRLGSDAPDSKRCVGTFEPAEAIKLIRVDPTCSNN